VEYTGKIFMDFTPSKSIYREDFKSVDKFTALRFMAAGALPAMRCMQILPTNQMITVGRR
jgi:hypothetical protein